MNAVLSKTKVVNKKATKISTILLCIILVLLPFDSYFGEKIPLPIIPVLLLMFIFMHFADNINYNFRNIKFTPMLAFIIYGMILNIEGGIFAGVSYNFFLYIFNTLFLISAVLGKYDKTEIMLFLKTAPISMAIFILICISNTEFFGGEIYISIRDTTDPNYFVMGMTLVVAMQMFMIFKEKKFGLKNFYIIELLIAFLYMILIGSRSGLLSCIAVVTLSIAFGAKKPKEIFIVFLSVFLLIMLISFPFLPEDLIDRFNFEKMIHSTGSGRTIIWRNYFDLYLNSNIFTVFFGFGRDYVPSIYYELFGVSGYYSHNLYVKTLAEGGLVGLFIFIILVFNSITKLIALKNGVILSAFIGLLIGSFFLDMDNMRVFWMILLFIYISNGKGRIKMWSGKSEVFNSGSNL